MSQRLTWIIFFHKTFPDEESLESSSLRWSDGIGIGYTALADLRWVFGQ